MDKKGRQPIENPAASANIFSKFVSQSWMNSLLKKGYKQSLDDSDIGEVLPRDSIEYLTDKLQRYWEHEVKNSEKPSLFVPLAKLAGAYYFSSLIYIILEIAMRLIQPIFIGKIVGVFQNEELDKRNGYIFAAIIGICAFSEAIIHHPLFLELLRTGMNLRIALSALVYRKALRMSQASLRFTNTGQIVNLVTNDVQKIEEVNSAGYPQLQELIRLREKHYSPASLYLLVAPFVIAVACYFCWVEIGNSFLPGMFLLFVLTPFQFWLGKYFAALRVKTAILRDERIKIMNEVICGMRVIKMYTWEHAFAKVIGRLRKEETKQILKICRLLSINAAIYLAAIPMVTLAMFVPYILTGNTLSSEKVFTVIAIIGSVHNVMTVFVPKSITALKESGVSLSRIKRFLQMYEGLTLSMNKVEEEQSSVVVQNVYSSWDKRSANRTLSDVSFQVSTGELLMVVGPVGCGKSSLLMALLRELPVISGDISLSGSIAYVSQQPWVFSGTLKENILFGKEYDTKKYQEVIRVCALEKDIGNFSDGDETLVGERGVSLSGGQKARVNLARAIYLDASIYIMDDPLSAVDSHVSKHIFNECIRGSLKSKVCILVSHQLQYLNDANRVLCLQEGKVVGYGSMESLQEQGIDILSMIAVKEEENGDNQVLVSKRKLERHLSHPPGMSRRKNALRNEDNAEANPLLESSDQSLHVQYKAKSAHDLGKYIAAEPDVVFSLSPNLRFTRAHDLKPRSASFQPMTRSHLDVDLIDIEDIASLEGENAEELAESPTTGSITFKVYKDFFLAGAKPAMIFFCCVIFLTGQVMLLISEWWLAKWSNWEESTLKRNDSESIIEEKRAANISIYVGLVVFLYLVAFIRAVTLLQILIAASRHLHDKMFKALLRAPIYFFDTNPVGRILNRFSKDIGLMDDVLPVTFFDAAQLSVLALAIILMTISSQPYASIAIVPIVIIFVVLRQYYIRSSREIKRLEARSRSPLYSHISATLQGLATIRASEEQPQFLNIYNKYQDYNSSAWFYYLAINRWLGFRLDILCALLMTSVSFAPFLAVEAGVSVSPVLLGLSLIYSKRLTGMFQFCVRQSAEVENQMVSVERIQEYTHIEPEAELDIEEQAPSANWPEHGRITAENVRFSYHSSLPNVLDNISFNIKAKEKIGIVGRTGAGKSSLISALFRLAEPKGKLMIDGVSITKIGLHDLRGRLSIIPQDPVIFAGSVRSNLDPFANHTDVELWDALQQVQLNEVVDNFPEKLEFLLTESGNNLSVGQRQLICLARAILKHNKILIIDEATANVDHRTDHLIQETIRDKFKDCTVLTIAHRLNTIMDADRIMVLDAGRVIEFEEPYELLLRPFSEFSKLVEQTGKQNALKLQRMARIAHEKRSCQ